MEYVYIHSFLLLNQSIIIRKKQEKHFYTARREQDETDYNDF